MKKSELRKLIKECTQEILLEYDDTEKFRNFLMKYISELQKIYNMKKRDVDKLIDRINEFAEKKYELAWGQK